MRKRADLTGQKFGRLTVIREIETNNGHRKFLCKCECGNEKVVQMNHLKSGNTKSCGCYRKERTPTNTIDIAGQKYGRLTVLKRSEKKVKYSAVWECKCDCGNIVDVATSDLKSGATKSCGCLLKENKLHEHIKKEKVDGVFIPWITKKSPPGASGVRGVRRRRKGDKIKWEAHIGIKNKNIYLGQFDTIAEAAEARKRAERKYYLPYLEMQKEQEEDND